MTSPESTLRERTHALLAHTADMGIAARAPDRLGLFAEMAHGLVVLMFGRTTLRPQRAVEIRLDGGDVEELLVAWLNEILYRFEVDGLVPADFTVHTLSEHHLEATVRGEDYQPQRHPVQRQVKAVTHHQVRLEQTSEGWVGQVYVDL